MTLVHVELKIGPRTLQFDGPSTEARDWLWNRLVEDADFIREYGPVQVRVFVVK